MDRNDRCVHIDPDKGIFVEIHNYNFDQFFKYVLTVFNFAH